MKAKDIFGLFVRAVGLIAVLDAVWNLVFGVFYAAGILHDVAHDDEFSSYFVFGVPALIVGILLLAYGRQIVRFTYPDNKDDADA